MSTTAAKPSLLDLLLHRKPAEPLAENFDREKGRAVDWVANVFSTGAALIFFFILLVCTGFIGMSILSGYGTVALGVLLGFEVVMAVSWLLWVNLVAPSRNSELERIHDHLDLISDQLKSAESRVDEVITVEPRPVDDDAIINYAVGESAAASPERLAELLALYGAAAQLLRDKLTPEPHA